MRKIFTFFMFVAIIALSLTAVRPTQASPGGTVGTGTTDTIWVKNLDVVTTYTRAWNWDIAKTGSTANLLLSLGESVQVNYSVTVTGVPVDSGWQASGNLSFRNNGANDVSITSVSVDFGDGIVVTPSCTTPPGYPPVVHPGYVINCTYATALPNGVSRTAVATVATADVTVSDSSPVVFGAPASETGQCIHVDDSLVGSLGTVCANGNPTVSTFSYSYSVGSYQTCGLYTIDNTAVIRETGKSASWVINVDVPCAGGCTLTQGYWKTHSRLGPAPYDAAWGNIGPLEEQTIFFLSGQTWYGVFSTAPAGNAYYTLAHQYMTARLNVLDGASAPAEVTAALASAETLFSTYTPGMVTRINRPEFLTLATLLDSYNNGLTGPGHCSE